jgi:hypothetical protein
LTEDINIEATEYLNALKRIPFVTENLPDDYTLLCPHWVDIAYTYSDTIRTKGLDKLDNDRKDLLTYIQIQDALNIDYRESKILMPRTYAESLKPIASHISVQVVVLSYVTSEGINTLARMVNSTIYGRTPYDRLWIEKNEPAEVLRGGEVLIVMNRRVGGWDGRPDKPVIELLGGGGHLSTIWDADSKRFTMMEPAAVATKELDEELRYKVRPDQIDIIGGFHNKTSNELVILCAVFVPFSEVVHIQHRSLKNFEENTAGIYLGRFYKVMELYRIDPRPYAGGERTEPSNFPSQPKLMNRIYQRMAFKRQSSTWREQ